MPSDEERLDTVPRIQLNQETDMVESDSDEDHDTAKRKQIQSSCKSSESLLRVPLARINAGKTVHTIVAITPEDSSFVKVRQL